LASALLVSSYSSLRRWWSSGFFFGEEIGHRGTINVLDEESEREIEIRLFCFVVRLLLAFHTGGYRYDCCRVVFLLRRCGVGVGYQRCYRA
jgi:hypothetical protein